MGISAGFLLGGAYCAGLFFASLLVRHLGIALWPGVILAGLGSLMVGVIAALVGPRRWPTGPWARLWLLAGLIAMIATLNYGWRFPMPGPLDVSHILDRGEAAGMQQEVWGQVQEVPRLTRSGKGQFWLKVDQIRSLDENDVPLTAPESATGKLYVTVPAEEIEDLFPGQSVEVRGRLYQPGPPKNPNGFNFQQYLADNQSFAGFSGKWVNPERRSQPPKFALWQLRKRIAAAQQESLGATAGPLVSAMALGRKAVNVPYEVQDAFIQAGLADTLAASGFHVCLVPWGVLAVMPPPAVPVRFRNPALAKVIVGFMALGGYALLTGGQPSVLRASLMGAGALIGLALERKVKPLGCLLLAVALLLLWNPSWIDNIGFRLSVMATLGLIVSVKPLTDWMEWLPTTLATVVAVPVAAYFWTIPLSLYYFNTLTTYSIILNMLVTPLVMVLSLGGIFTGLVAALEPGIGAMLAWVLWLPAHGLIRLVHWEVSLPASSLATGHISLMQMLGLYGLYLLGWHHRWWRRRLWLVGLLLLLLAMGPLWYRGATLAEATVLAAGEDAVMVVQDHRSSLLINSGTGRTGVYTVVPFLKQAGINRLNHAIDFGSSDAENWATVVAQTPIQDFWTWETPEDSRANIHDRHVLLPGEPAIAGPQTLQRLNGEIPVVKVTLFGSQNWLMVSPLTTAQEAQLLQRSDLASDVLWWKGSSLSQEFLTAVHPQVAIASARVMDARTEQALKAQGVQVFCPERDGAVTWSQRRGYYQAYLRQNTRSAAQLD
jgi:competence protein ComEC